MKKKPLPSIPLFVIAFSFLVSQIAVAQITVVAGTYGKNCKQLRGNKTEHLAKTCNGYGECKYKIEHQVIGDPAVGCAKDYIAEWRCGTSAVVHSVSASPEAGYGKIVTLQCTVKTEKAYKKIHVIAGTYGKNCKQPNGNKTEYLAKACDGRRGVCEYKIDHTVIGDPAVGCAKNYIAKWRCGKSQKIRKAKVKPEAGFGKYVTLRCKERSVMASGKIHVVAGTYGKNCKQSRGNKTAHIAKMCNGQGSCKYKIEHQVIGDPAVGCAKDYIAEWRCGTLTQVHSVTATPEAGFGKVITMTCQ